MYNAACQGACCCLRMPVAAFWYLQPRSMSTITTGLHALLSLYCHREADNNSKHLQLVSGAHPTAYWLANFSWDLINYCLPAAGIVLLVYWYHQPQLSGIRLVAMALLLLAFGGAGINLTYLCHYMFVVSRSNLNPIVAVVTGPWLK